MVVGQEWIVLIVLAIVLIFGAKKIPELARSLGRAKMEFEKGKMEVEKELREIKEMPTSTSTTTKEGEEEKIFRVAKELGINTEGKTGKELKEEIAKRLTEK